MGGWVAGWLSACGCPLVSSCIDVRLGGFLQVAVPEPGKYRVVIDSDGMCYGGKGRVGWDVDHFTNPEQSKFNDRDQSMLVSWGGG